MTSHRVLIVDDEPSLRRVVEVNLSARGYQVDVAGCGEEALRLVAAGPDLVVLDLGLPDMDGLDLLPRLRDRTTGGILVASARDPRTTAPMVMAAGATDFLAKPFSVDQLLAKVRTILAGSRPGGGGAPGVSPGGMYRFSA